MKAGSRRDSRAGAVESAPTPVLSSSITDWKWMRAVRRRSPAALIASSANSAAMVPDFMSPAPRPYILPSSMTGANGGVSHISSGPAGTTSQWPCRISDLPGLLAGPIGADHRAGAREIVLDRTEAAQVLQVVLIDDPVIHLVAALAQQAADHVLARPFGAARRGDRDKIPRHRKLRVEALRPLLPECVAAHRTPP